jgi:hypothetical protein
MISIRTEVREEESGMVEIDNNDSHVRMLLFGELE